MKFKIFAQDPDVFDIAEGQRDQGIYIREIGEDGPFRGERDVDEFDAGVNATESVLIRNLSDAQIWAKGVAWLEGEEIVEFEIID